MESINQSVCFTGHRNQKLPWGFNEEDIRYMQTRQITKLKITEAINQGKTHFISGMALGFDIMCAEIVLELKQKFPFITLECAIPCQDQEKFWNDEAKHRYYKVLKSADRVFYVSQNYTRFCMHKRNAYMLKNSSLVIALFNGQRGGTKNTIELANTQNKEVWVIEPVSST